MNVPELGRSAAGTSQVHRWEMPAWWLPFMVGILLVVMVVFGSLASVRLIENEGWLGAAFMTAWFTALVWNVYWWLFRVAYRLELRGERLYWRAPFARGSLSVQSIIGVAPFLGITNQMPTIQAVGSRNVPVFAYGESSFLARLNVINSAIPDRLRGFAGLYDTATCSVATRREGRRTDA